jgi:hypothetical protein
MAASLWMGGFRPDSPVSPILTSDFLRFVPYFDAVARSHLWYASAAARI